MLGLTLLIGGARSGKSDLVVHMITGDVLGAIEQIAACSILVIATGLVTRHPIWWR